MVDLGHRITMFSPTDGIAISRGMGTEVKGKAYRFVNGQWSPFYDFPYSDYPLIARVGASSMWTITHLTHAGAYRPIHSEWKNGTRREIPLPAIMWDEIDYVMFKGLHRFSDGTAWAVGQQGHIIYYDGNRWNRVSSPLINPHRTTVYDGDLNDIAMTSRTTGWAVGRNGNIIRFENGIWKKAESPTDQTLQKISMADDSTGWAVGNAGTILECRNGQWKKHASEIREQLNSVVTLSSSEAWIVGNNSTLLEWDGSRWVHNRSIALYDDTFADVAVVKDSTGAYHRWVIGHQGIYTTSQAMGFSFTDITHPAGLRRVGRRGHFFHRSNRDLPDLLVANDGGTSLLYENDGTNTFADVTAETELRDSPRDPLVTAVGDVNNDGEADVLVLVDHTNYRLYLGTFDGDFRDFTERSELRFQEIDPLGHNAADFVDVDNDGNLDLYLSNFDLPDQIFLGDGSGKFRRVEIDLGIDKILRHSSYGAVIEDFNNDRRPDILIPYYVSSGRKFFSLFLQKENFSFVEADDSLFFSSVDLSPTAMTAADFNNDGTVDLYIHSQKVPPKLWLNDGTGKFTDRSQQAGFGTPIVHPEPTNGIVAAADVNNDGWTDIFDGSKLFLNSPDGRFVEVSERVGIQFVGSPAFADIDHDGDLDLFIGSSRSALGKGDRAALFRNNLDRRTSIVIRVSGDESNRSAIGAVVTLRNSRGEKQTRIVGSGGSPLIPQNISGVHFGAVDGEEYSVTVEFPSGRLREERSIVAGDVRFVSENPFLISIGNSAVRSFGRTASLFSYGRMQATVVAATMVILLFVFVGKRIGADKISSRWYNSAVLLLLFGMSIHLTIYESTILSVGSSFAGTAAAALAWLTVGRAVIRRREARFVSHYRIGELIGTGGMGKVYSAVDTTTKQHVALKVLHPELLNDPDNRRRLTAEGHLLASFEHPNIVKVFEIGESLERGYIAMEFLSGGTLREKVEREHPLPLPEIRKIILQICAGLAEVHRKGIVHRDLKSGNVMLAADGTVRIMDFGLSKSPLVTTKTSLGTVLGTLGYVAPEQVTSLDVDGRTDIFSLGVIFYEMLTKQLPFTGENEIALIHSIFNTVPPPPSALRSDVPEEWDRVVARCLSKDPNGRFADANEIQRMLE